jgi:hypothetical protein
MTCSMILEYWSSVFLGIAIIIDSVSNWPYLFDYIKATIDINQ